MTQKNNLRNVSVNCRKPPGKSYSFEIDAEIFKAMPKITVFLGVVHNIDVNKLDRDGIQKFLEESWKSAHEQISTYPNVHSHPNVQLWRQAFQSMKISTKKYVSSVESMSRRTVKSDAKPHSINPLVDFYNAFCLKYLIPFGGFDLMNDIGKSMHLRFSRPGDKFLALDSDERIDVPLGEPLYASGNTCITRYINWKQSKEGLIQEKTTDICLQAEALNGYPEAQLMEMQDEFKKRCLDLLHAEAEVYILNEDKTLITY